MPRLVAGFNTGGADGFFSGHLASERKPLEVGASIEDKVRIELVGPKD